MRSQIKILITDLNFLLTMSDFYQSEGQMLLLLNAIEDHFLKRDFMKLSDFKVFEVVGRTVGHWAT